MLVVVVFGKLRTAGRIHPTRHGIHSELYEVYPRSRWSPAGSRRWEWCLKGVRGCCHGSAVFLEIVCAAEFSNARSMGQPENPRGRDTQTARSMSHGTAPPPPALPPEPLPRAA